MQIVLPHPKTEDRDQALENFHVIRQFLQDHVEETDILGQHYPAVYEPAKRAYKWSALGLLYSNLFGLTVSDMIETPVDEEEPDTLAFFELEAAGIRVDAFTEYEGDITVLELFENMKNFPESYVK